MRELSRKQIAEFLPEWLSLLAVLGLALTLRLIFVTGVVFLDDLTYAQAAHDLTLGSLQLGPWSGLPRLGLYSPVAVLYALFGVSDATTLVWPLFCSLLTVVFVYFISRLLAGETAGLLSALLWAVFPLDIQMATALLPDAPLATFTTGCVLFFLIGERSQNHRATLAYSASLACLAVAMLIKPLAIILLAFFAAYLAWKRSSCRTWGFVIASVLVTGMLFLYYRFAFSRDPSTGIPGENAMLSQTSGLDVLSNTATDWFRQLTQQPEFVVFVPLFIVALTVSLVTRQRNTNIPLLWASAVFLYFELGSMTPFRYAPIPASLMSRQILLVMVPFVILTGIYLAQAFDQRSAQWGVMGLTVAIGSVALWNMYERPISSPFLTLSSISAALAIFVSIASPVFVLGPTNRTNLGLTMLLICGVSFAALHPIYGMVSQYYHLKLARARQVVNWIQSQPTDYPVFVDNSGEDTGLAGRLVYASGFKLGSRIRHIVSAQGPEDSAFVVIQSGSKIESIPEAWSKMAAFDVLQIYRSLSVDDAASELQMAQSLARSQPGRDSLLRLLSAATNADAPCIIAWAWQELRTIDAVARDVAAPIQAFSRCLITQPEIVGQNLLRNGSFERLLDDWDRDPIWRLPVVDKDDNGIASVLNVAADGTEDWRIILQTVELKPDTPYVFEMDIKSTARLVALYWQSDDFTSYLEEGNTYPDWTHLQVVFITPHWDGQPRPVQIYPFLLKGAGTVSLKQVRLAQLQVAAP